jgi:four helix bundle protein
LSVKSTLANANQETECQARRYQDLIAWQKAIALVKRVYEITSSFPQKEVFGLTSQIGSVNPEQHCGRTRSRYAGRVSSVLRHARGSLDELETQLVIASELGYASTEQGDPFLADSRELGRILNVLMSSVSKQQLPVRVLTTDN